MEETLSYEAWLHFEGTDGVGVTFPDFPGCVTQGATGGCVASGARSPRVSHRGSARGRRGAAGASPADDVVKERAGELLTMVNVRDPRPRERINISLTAGQVAKIDHAAARNGMTRSAFVVAAALGLKKKR